MLRDFIKVLIIVPTNQFFKKVCKKNATLLRIENIFKSLREKCNTIKNKNFMSFILRIKGFPNSF